MAAAVPLMVTEDAPLPVMVAPAKDSAVSVPLFADTIVVKLMLSASATLMALPLATLKTTGVSSLVACAPGTVLMGGEATLTVTFTLAVSSTPPELTV